MFQEYPQKDVNEPILLHQGRFGLRWVDDQLSEGPGSARLIWLPSPGIEIDIDIGTDALRTDLNSVTLELPGFETNNVVVKSLSVGPHGRRVRVFVSKLESGCERDPLVTVGFQLVNFTDVITPELFAAPDDPMTLTYARKEAQQLLKRGGVVTRSTASLEHDGWQVDLVAVSGAADVYKGLESSGGYGFTHVGRLTRVDGSAFTAERASTILKSLTAFLTFARGAACSIPIRWGYGTTGEVDWRQFCWPVVDRWTSSQSSWFDKKSGSLLTEMFDAFCQKHNDKALRESLVVALHWYRHCNTQSSGMEGSLVLGMAALELLSALVVAGQNQMSVAKHDRLSAAKKLRVLLQALKVTADIPSRFKALTTFAANTEKSDSCEAIVALRNGFVHSNETRRKVVFGADGSAATSDAWWLSLWYQELALLYLLNHRGSYANRTTAGWEGQVEPVPWSGCSSAAGDEGAR